MEEPTNENMLLNSFSQNINNLIEQNRVNKNNLDKEIHKNSSLKEENIERKKIADDLKKKLGLSNYIEKIKSDIKENVISKDKINEQIEKIDECINLLDKII